MFKTVLIVAGLTTTLFAGAASAASAAANLVVNGSFEQVQIGSPFNSVNAADIPAWTHTGAAGDALLWTVGYTDGSGTVTVASDGKQFVTAGAGFLQNPSVGTWTQTVSGLTVGDTYDLSFKIAGEATFSSTLFVDVSASDTSLTTQTFAAPIGGTNYWSLWTGYSVSFVANSASTTLSFGSNTSFDVGIDDVSLTASVGAVPEPQTYAMMLAGLCLLGAVARRKLSRKG